MRPPALVTPLQWLAVLAIWSLVAYGLVAPARPEARRDRAHLIACRYPLTPLIPANAGTQIP